MRHFSSDSPYKYWANLLTGLLLLTLGLRSEFALAQQSSPAPATAKASRPPEADDSPVPYNQAPIDYEGPDANDPVARLIERLRERPDLLLAQGKQGYLKSVLQALDVPVSSQLLVYSKSSAQARLITPETPRAIYFNDEVYVGWVPESKVIEISSVDPHKGGMFYRLEQNSQPPTITRDASCLLCHITSSTLRVPGHVVRSFLTDTQGQMLHGYSRITHDTPHPQRFGGWYITGEVGAQPHLGNLVGRVHETQRQADPAFRNDIPHAGEFASLAGYLSPHSDAVAHQVLIHQSHGHNLITRLNYEARLNQELSALEPLVRYLVFADEAPWPKPMTGSTKYADWFQKQWAPDSEDRSLRQLNLQTRLFEYRLSYLIETRSFRSLPEQPRNQVLRRIGEILHGRDLQLQHQTAEERQAILGLLDELHPEWASELHPAP